MKLWLLSALLLCLTITAGAQNQSPAFEVASIKPLGSFPGIQDHLRLEIECDTTR
jgi:hypothetical protein